MAVDTMSVGFLRKCIAQKINNSDDIDPSTISEVTVALHCAYSDLIRISHAERFLSNPAGAITLVEGQSVYDLDDDVHMLVEESMRLVETPYWRLMPMTQQQYTTWGVYTSSVVGTPSHYMLNGSSAITGKLRIKVWPTPNSSAAGKTITYRKVPVLPSLMEADDDTLLDLRFPREWFHFLWVGALTFLPNYLSRENMEMWSIKWHQYLQDARRMAWPVEGWSDQHENYRAGGSPTGPWPMLSGWPLNPNGA